MKRGIVRIKPVLIGISHYREVHGSVCSADVEGTPTAPPPASRPLAKTI